MPDITGSGPGQRNHETQVSWRSKTGLWAWVIWVRLPQVPRRGKQGGQEEAGFVWERGVALSSPTFSHSYHHHTYIKGQMGLAYGSEDPAICPLIRKQYLA